MTAITDNLHLAFLQPLGDAVMSHSDVHTKPLCVDLALPNPPKLRVYMYSLVDAVGTTRAREYKAVLRLPRQRVGHYASFDHSSGRVALVVGYCSELDVFVFWDSSLHPRFKNGGNIQVRDATVHTAAAIGRAEQVRTLAGGVNEVVIACQSWNLAKAIDDRVAWTGGVTEGEWAPSQS